MNNTRRVKTFVGGMTLAAAIVVGYAAFVSHAQHLYFALSLLGLAAVTSRMKVKLPGIDGNMSVNLPFLLIAVANLSAAEAILITCVSTAVQCWPQKPAKFKPQQMTFNVSMMAFATCLASLMFHAGTLSGKHSTSAALALIMATATLFVGQTTPVAAIIALSESKAAGPIWWRLAHLSFPYYVLTAGVSFMVQTASSRMGWPLSLAVFPVMYVVHRSYRLYFEKFAETARPDVLVCAAKAGA